MALQLAQSRDVTALSLSTLSLASSKEGAPITGSSPSAARLAISSVFSGLCQCSVLRDPGLEVFCCHWEYLFVNVRIHQHHRIDAVDTASRHCLPDGLDVPFEFNQHSREFLHQTRPCFPKSIPRVDPIANPPNRPRKERIRPMYNHMPRLVCLSRD